MELICKIYTTSKDLKVISTLNWLNNLHDKIKKPARWRAFLLVNILSTQGLPHQYKIIFLPLNYTGW